MQTPNLIINGHVCSEAEVRTIEEALDLLMKVGQGRLAEVGDTLFNEFLPRRDTTAEFRVRVRKARDLIAAAHAELHRDTPNAKRFDAETDVVPVSAVRAHLLLCHLNGDAAGIARTAEQMSRQADGTND